MKKFQTSLIIVLTLIISGYISFDLLTRWHTAKVNQSKSIHKETFQEKIDTLEKEVTLLKEELEASKDTPVPVEKITGVFGETVTRKLTNAPVEGDIVPDCRSILQGATSFFTYLDNRGYGEKNQISGGTFDYFNKAIQKLTVTKPEYTGDSTEILTILRSMSHFYRVLGKQGTSLVKDILANEPEITEPAMALFYEVFNSENACPNDGVEIPSLQTLYEYSHFFLNTMAGKSYLLRRSSKNRILATYYSVLIMDQANAKTLNHYGFDIKPVVALLFSDIENHRDLMFKKKYLEELKRISRR